MRCGGLASKSAACWGLATQKCRQPIRHLQFSGNLHPLTAFLQDIRKALSTDLTKPGLVAVQEWTTSANERASKVQTALAQSATEFDALSARTSSSRVQDVK